MTSSLALFKQAWLQRLIFAVFMLMLSAIIGVSVYQDYGQVRDTKYEKLASQANVVAINIETHIAGVDRMLTEILNQQRFLNMTQQRDHMQSLLNAMPAVRTISVLDGKGWQVMGTHTENNGINFGHLPYFHGVAADPQALRLYISQPYVSERGDLTISLSKAILDPDGGFRGVVALALEPVYLTSLMEAALYAPDMWAALADIHGDKVIRVQGGTSGQQQDVTSDKLGLAQLSPDFPDGRPLILDGRDGAGRQLVAASAIANPASIEKSTLQIIMGRDYRTAMNDWYGFTYLQGGLLGLFFVTTLAGLIILQRRQAKYAARRANYLRRIRRDKHRIQTQERDYRIIVEHTSTCIVRLDTNGDLSYVNPAFSSLFGLSCDQAEKLSFSSLIAKDDAEPVMRIVEDVLHQSSEQHFRAQHTTPQGMLHMEWVLCPVAGPDHGIEGIIGIGHDISAHVSLNKKLRTLADQDGLTGLYNRRHFMDAGANQVAQAHRYGQALSIMMLDLDHFKKINDTHGHHAGDLALQSCSRLMQQISRASDIPARIGGEEFAILLPGTPLEGALLAAQRLCKMIEQQPIQLEHGDCFSVTVSIGIAMLRPAETLDELMQRADQRLYWAKENGRNRVGAGHEAALA